jgi:hypothetical protein
MTRRNIAFNITLSGDRRRARGTVYTFQPLSPVRRALNFQVEFFFFNTRQQLQETRVKRVKRVRGDKRRRGSRHYTTTTTTVLHVLYIMCVYTRVCMRV